LNINVKYDSTNIGVRWTCKNATLSVGWMPLTALCIHCTVDMLGYNVYFQFSWDLATHGTRHSYNVPIYCVQYIQYTHMVTITI